MGHLVLCDRCEVSPMSVSREVKFTLVLSDDLSTMSAHKLKKGEQLLVGQGPQRAA